MKIITIFTALLILFSFVDAQAPRVQVSVDTSEAEAVLMLLDKLAAQKEPSEADWNKLFETAGYLRLKKRELSMNRPFTDGDFKAFVRSPELAARRVRLAGTLAGWKTVDTMKIADLPLAYLPPTATIRATIYPVIKPRDNSFVFDVPEDPAIFMYIDPDKSKEVFENELAHELHHIGYGTACTASAVQTENPNTAKTVKWLGAFGEGFAMLAAAGGPGIHPHKYSPLAERERWDADVKNFNSDLKKVERFFLDLSNGKLSESDEITTARSFYGIQGPWYTVGWKMATVIERVSGRKRLIDVMCQPRELLPAYNRAAPKYNRETGEGLAIWSDELIAKLK